MKRLNRFLNWAEGWMMVITVLVLMIWVLTLEHRIKDLEDHDAMWVEGMAVFNEKHLGLHEVEADVRDHRKDGTG